MNRRLLDPFQSVELPEIIEEYLDHGTAQCLAFNRRGTLLASGTKEGNLVLWDFDTRGVAAVYKGHQGPITCLSWSRNGRRLLSGSEDQHVILWDVESGAQVCKVKLASSVVQASLSPRAPHTCVVSLAEGAPVVLELETQKQETLQLPADADAPQGKVKAEGGAGGSAASAALAIYNKAADLIIVGQAKGPITVFDAASKAVLDVIRVPNSARITALSLNRKGTLLLATCQDQRVRLYDVLGREAVQGEEPPSEKRIREALGRKTVRSGSALYGEDGGGLLQPVREFQNAVERTPWRAACFSCDSEHVVGAIANKALHQVYIWNRPLGNMEKILDGPKEGTLDLAWHPLRSLLLTCSSTGRIYIWAKIYAENWSAFAPDFKELDENIEYVEQEDEFDWATPGAGGDLRLKADGTGAAGEDGAPAAGEEDSAAAALDILTRQEERAFSSDDEEDVRDTLLYLPVVVQPDEGAMHAAREAAVPPGPSAAVPPGATIKAEADGGDGQRGPDVGASAAAGAGQGQGQGQQGDGEGGGGGPATGGDDDGWGNDGGAADYEYEEYEQKDELMGEQGAGGDAAQDPDAAADPAARKRGVQFGERFADDGRAGAKKGR